MSWSKNNVITFAIIHFIYPIIRSKSSSRVCQFHFVHNLYVILFKNYKHSTEIVSKFLRKQRSRKKLRVSTKSKFYCVLECLFEKSMSYLIKRGCLSKVLVCLKARNEIINIMQTLTCYLLGTTKSKSVIQTQQQKRNVKTIKNLIRTILHCKDNSGFQKNYFLPTMPRRKKIIG